MVAEIIWAHDTEPIAPWGVTGETPGTAIVATVPESRVPDALPAAILAGLGKPRNALRSERVRQHAWPIIEAWLHGHRIETIVLLAAHRLSPADLHTLTEHAGPVDTVALIYPTPPGRAARRSLDLGAPTATNHVARLARRLRRPHSDRCTRINALPLPDSSFLTFRADARRYLTPPLFETVDQQYLSGYRSVAERLAAHSTGFASSLDITNAEINDIIDSLAADNPDPTTHRIRLKAAQAAFFRRSLLLRLPERPPHPYTDHTLAAGILERLSVVATPAVAAAAILTVAATGRLRVLTGLRLADFQPGDGLFTVALGQPIAIPRSGMAAVEAHVAYRTASAPSPTDPLFTTPSGTKATQATVRGLVRRAERIAGVTVTHAGYTDADPLPLLYDRPTVVSLRSEPAWRHW